MNDPLIILVGAERSGTTLLHSMLDSHSEVAMVYEPHILIEILPGPRSDSLDWREFLSRFVAHRWFSRWNLDPAKLETLLAELRPGTYQELVGAVYHAYAAGRGKRRAGDKTPSYVRRILDISRRLPDSVFVHLIRDGRDCATSLRDAPFGPDTWEAAVASWSASVGAGRAAGRRLGRDRYLEVRYENLVCAPESVLPEVCAFLRLEYEQDMTDYGPSAAQVRASRRESLIHPRLDGTIRTGLRDWRTELSAAELAAFDKIAGALNRDCGYED